MKTARPERIRYEIGDALLAQGLDIIYERDGGEVVLERTDGSIRPIPPGDLNASLS